MDDGDPTSSSSDPIMDGAPPDEEADATGWFADDDGTEDEAALVDAAGAAVPSGPLAADSLEYDEEGEVEVAVANEVEFGEEESPHHEDTNHDLLVPPDGAAFLSPESPLSPRHAGKRRRKTTTGHDEKSSSHRSSPDGTGTTMIERRAGASTTSAGWEPMFQRLVTFKNTHGHCNVPKGCPDDPQLARWVERVRALGNKVSSEIIISDDGCHQLSSDAGEVLLTNVAAGHAHANEEPEPRDSAKPASDVLLVTADRKEKLSSLGFVWSLRGKRFGDQWDAMFRQLCEYKEAHGDCLVPSRYELNPKLAKWVETQRYTYSKRHQISSEGIGPGGSALVEVGKPRGARLSEDRIRRLNEIGFEWKVKNKMDQFHSKLWDDMFERLCSYRELHGDCLVPKRYAPDPQLAAWVHTQRIQHRKSSAPLDHAGEQGEIADPEISKVEGPPDGLSAERCQRLNDVGFSWSARTVERPEAQSKIVPRNCYDNWWDTMFARLEQYKQKHGDCLVPKRYKEDAKLGTWCDTQRVAFKKKRKLAQTIDDTSASSTVEIEKSEFPSESTTISRLSDERIRRLEELGFVWSVRDDWHCHYEELKQFKVEHGHCNVPARYEQNRKLGIFVAAQRSQYKALQQMLGNDQGFDTAQTCLTRERIGLLNELGFAWSIRSKYTIGESWNQKLNELKFYREVHGHCNVPARCSENPGLGIWVATQRTQYRLFMRALKNRKNPQEVSSMTEERIHKLEEVGFNWTVRGDGKLLDSLADGFDYDVDAAMVTRDVYPLHED